MFQLNASEQFKQGFTLWDSILLFKRIQLGATGVLHLIATCTKAFVVSFWKTVLFEFTKTTKENQKDHIVNCLYIYYINAAIKMYGIRVVGVNDV